jgi:hypothetical protein
MLVALGALALAAAGWWRYGPGMTEERRNRRTVADVTTALDAEVQARLDLHEWPAALTLLAIKDERRLEVWRTDGAAPTLVRSYAFTAFSGRLGPKLREGDGQIPEGIYAVESLNPNSKFHLAVRVGYPNEFERDQGRRDGREDLGGDIMIHGSRVTSGCIPIGDTGIEEVFLLVAHAGLDNCRILIAPTDFRLGHPPPETDVAWAPAVYAELTDALAAYVIAAE